MATTTSSSSSAAFSASSAVSVVPAFFLYSGISGIPRLAALDVVLWQDVLEAFVGPRSEAVALCQTSRQLRVFGDWTAALARQRRVARWQAEFDLQYPPSPRTPAWDLDSNDSNDLNIAQMGLW
jgi:hypothetical protein